MSKRKRAEREAMQAAEQEQSMQAEIDVDGPETELTIQSKETDVPAADSAPTVEVQSNSKRAQRRESRASKR